jgi:23S rRNA pseudouridine1911/1915/1917 synthase
MESRLRHTPPYDKTYYTHIGDEFVGKSVIDFYSQRFRFLSREQWLEVIASGVATVNGVVSAPDQILQNGDVIRTDRRGVMEPPVNDVFDILYDADGLFVINKPAPLPVHPSGRYWKNTLTEILIERYPAIKFHPIYRLDSWTTGVLILAKTEAAARVLHRQVMKKKMRKLYAVMARGVASLEPFDVAAPIGRGLCGFRAAGDDTREPKPALTRFWPLLQKDDITLLAAEPVTGRTNQIRVHLQHVGAHVLNDPLYGPEAPPNKDAIPFLGLHCRRMQFEWPAGNPFEICAPWPKPFIELFGSEKLEKSFSS